MQKSNLTTNIVYIVILVLLGISVYTYFNTGQVNQEEGNISQIAQEVENGNIEKIEVDGNKVTAKEKNSDKEIKTYKESDVGLSEYGITPDKVQIDIKDDSRNAIWVTLISIILPFVLIAAFLWFMLRQAQGGNMKAMSFGKSSARLFVEGKKKITFDSVAGLKESKEELREVVDFLKNPKKYQKLGAEIPKGTLLIGPPGCGKTLLAKAVAGEAGVPFYSLSASEFVEMFVGVGASRVRDLFKKAKRNAPALIFIDELDAVGRQRGTGLGGSHDEREQTLNQILVEMDGFETDENVIVIAATNRPDVLDPALLRPGRFDRQVVVHLPDKKEREEILAIHGKNKPLDKDVNFERISAATAGLSGADLRNIVNEAAILAAKNDKDKITQLDIQHSIEKILLGPEKKSRVLLDQEKKITAFHEAGHAIVGHILPGCEDVHKVSIISRGRALGYTWSLPKEDIHLYSKSKFEDQIAQLLAGRAAEKLTFGETTTGAENDMKQASKLARNMVTVYGMSDKIGPQTLGEREELVFLGRELGEHKNYSEKVAAIIDDEVTRIIRDGETKAEQVLTKKKLILKNIAEKLLKDETIDEKTFTKMVK
jgi:cell division protease FtsH